MNSKFKTLKLILKLIVCISSNLLRRFTLVKVTNVGM
jgi:hypothetical protein